MFQLYLRILLKRNFPHNLRTCDKASSNNTSDLLCDLHLSSSCLMFNVLSESLRLGGFEMFPSKKKPKVKPVKQTVSVLTSVQGC